MSETTMTLLMRTPLLADKLADRLRREISAGRYKRGQRLPTERELAEAYGVSRPVVREALGRLKQDNLVVSRQGSGAFVSEGGSSNVFRLDTFDALDPVEVTNIVELLTAVESAASAHAAARRTKAQLAAIKARFDDMEAAIGEGQPGVDEDVAFHRAIIDATGNPVFRDLLDFLDTRVRSFIRTARTNSARFTGLTRQVQTEHAAILQAIAERDEDGARKAAEDHLNNALARLAQYLPGWDESAPG
jgi:GntR family transcriptional repressor for pyruvate dehydrogenase complex